jgi:hypothetical protein
MTGTSADHGTAHGLQKVLRGRKADVRPRADVRPQRRRAAEAQTRAP